MRTIVRPNFLLAVEDLRERKIRQVLITSRGYVTEGFHVTRIRNNGVASRFEVTYPENMAILALRTTVHSGNGLKEVVYTPYSPEIDTKEVRKAGLDYLMGRITLARNDLAAKRVRLAEFERGNGIPMEISLVLSIIEHIDPVRFEPLQGQRNSPRPRGAHDHRREHDGGLPLQQVARGSHGPFPVHPHHVQEALRAVPERRTHERFCLQGALTMSTLPRPLSSFSTPTS